MQQLELDKLLDTELKTRTPTLQTKDITAPTRFTCTNVNAVNVESAKGKGGGIRIDFTLMNAKNQPFIASDWNLFIEEGFPPRRAVGKDVILSPYNDKRLKWEFA